MHFIAQYKKEIQVLFDLLIPIVGLILGWEFALILFFVLLDILAKYVLNILKWKKLLKENRVAVREKKRARPLLMINASLLVMIMIGLVISVQSGTPPAKVFDVLEVNINLMLEAAGNEIWLVPLVLAGSYLQYTMDFVRAMEYRYVEVKGFMLKRVIENMTVLFSIPVILFGDFAQTFSVILLVGIKALVEMLHVRKEKALMLKNLNGGL